MISGVLMLAQPVVLSEHANLRQQLAARLRHKFLGGVIAGARRLVLGIELQCVIADRQQVGQLFRRRRALRDRRGTDTGAEQRSEEHTSELQSLMRISDAVFCLKKKK